MNKQRRYRAPWWTITLVLFLINILLAPRTVTGAEQPKDVHEMEVLGMASTPGGDPSAGQAGQTAILLRSKGTKRELTLFVGPLEAHSIAVPLQRMTPPRPLTHDLILALLATLRSRVGRVVITDFKDNVYYATLYIETHDKEIAIDSRPSDAIALALRTGAPIYASSNALDGTSVNQALQ